MSDKYNGWIQLIMAGVAAFLQIWTTIHGAPFDPAHTAVTVALAANGVNHLTAKK